MTSATRILRIQGAGPFIRPVCVFGLVTASGKLVEAHSLQLSDSNSDAAVKDATAIDFSPSVTPGSAPHQHFAFVIVRFANSTRM
jgi:hypothetical protein